MTRSTVKMLTEPLDEPKRKFWRLRRASLRHHQNESLAIAGRNLIDDEASSSNVTRTKPVTPLKILREHSLPYLAGKAKEWLDKMPLSQITTWDQLVTRFLDYFFPVGHTLFLRDMILRFKQGTEEPIKSA
ncbi:reverse transcriptase [Tanacetum coccineum]